MNDIFFSKQNINNLLNRLDNEFPNKNYDKKKLLYLVQQVMNYVSTKVSDKIPLGYTQQQYNQLMNNKSIQLIKPLLPSLNIQPINTNMQKQKNTNVVQPQMKTKTGNELYHAYDKMPPMPEPVLKRDFDLNDAVKYKQEDDVRYISQSEPSKTYFNSNIDEDEEKNINHDEINNILNEVENEFVDNNPQMNNEIHFKFQQFMGMNDNYDSNVNKEKDILLNLAPDGNQLLKNAIDKNSNYSEQTDIKMIHETNMIKDPLYNPSNMKSAYPSTTYPIIPQNKTKYIIKSHFITVDSADRDLELYPSPTEFQVKFEPASDTTIIQEVVDKNGNFLFNEKVKYVASGNGASIDIKFNNIQSIRIACAIFPLERKWVCGNCPYEFNGPVVEHGRPNGPIYTSDVGIEKSILDELYIILKIRELESWSPYSGTNKANKNAFAKLIYCDDYGILTKFVKFKTCNSDEKLVFEPQALATLDKMTLKLEKPNGLPLCFANDKTYICKFNEGDMMRNCCEHGTLITINCDDKCNPCIDNGHCLQPGDKIYIYSVKPLCDDIIYFSSNIKLWCININDSEDELNLEDDTISDYMNDNNKCELVDLVFGIDDCHKCQINEEHEHISSLCFNYIININDYLAIKYKHNSCGIITDLLRIHDVCENILKVNLKELQYADMIDEIDIISLGIVRNNKKGVQSNDANKINYIGGVTVCSVTDKCKFEVDFPFRCLDIQYGDTACVYFFIKQKLQISYTFEINTLEKDYCQLDSEAIF